MKPIKDGRTIYYPVQYLRACVSRSRAKYGAKQKVLDFYRTNEYSTELLLQIRLLLPLELLLSELLLNTRLCPVARVHATKYHTQ